MRFDILKINISLVVRTIQNIIFANTLKYMKMRNLYFKSIAAASLTVLLSSCGMFGKKSSKGSVLPNDGQVHGVAPGAKYTLPKPPGMVLHTSGYIPYGSE
jgi:hypothetical protein